MLKQTTFVLFLLLASFCSIFSQEGQEMTDEQKVWMEYMTPSWGHEMLSHGVGDYTYTAKFWMTPDAEPIVSEGKAKGEMILGGRYLQMHHSGEMWGMPFEGISLEGYDNAKKEFFSTWIDNMGTGLMYATGNYDAEGKTLTYNGTYCDPMDEGKDKPFKQTIHFKEDNTMLLEMYMEVQGTEFKNMEIVFTKK
ncbi:MAG: DUF1579 domain-containing protein [Melioribacteraceae bacterium]|nr:DUF1579 domain-containing protein [Melioribacteraceae bacterium]MCO6472474.1 DUF1579 domain-containing protein [Melioribacteraceae bacterium]MDD3558770.1 DUF1579 domain-containing protein [Melioribacteraceae bacterium]